MHHVGIDLGRRQSHACTRLPDGKLRHARFKTTREQLTALLSGRTGRVLLEASANSEWVARHIEGLGWEVIVGDPNFAPMYADRNRRVKTDRRDAEALLLACEKGNYRKAHRLSDAARRVRVQVAARKVLVRARGQGIVQARGVLNSLGLEQIKATPDSFTARWNERVFPADVAEDLAQLQPILDGIASMSTGLGAYDKKLGELAKMLPDVRRLMTAPGVGAVTAATWVGTLDTPTRFRSGEAVAAYLGLVACVWSSSEMHRQGHITKRGPRELRSLLVEAAWSVMRSRHADGAPLREWARKVAQRRGSNVAAVALARRLAVILFAMWRDQTDFDMSRVGRLHRVEAS